MKKLLVLFLTLVLCVAVFAACGDEPETPEVTYKLDKAVAYVKSLYIGEEIKADGAEVAVATKYADFERVSSVPIAGVTYEVIWSVSETDTTKVKVVQGSGTTPTVIDVNEKTQEDISFTLTATVKAGDGTTAKITFNILVPKYDVISFEQYMAAKENDQVTIEGIVVAINSKAAGNSRNHLFLADANVKGGYYSYQMDKDPVKDLGIEIGMTVAVSGPVSPYSGMQEIKGGTARIISTEKKTVAPYDITEEFKSGASLKNYVGLPVTIKGVEIGNQVLDVATSQYLYFSLNGVESYLRTYVTDFPTTLKIVTDAEGNATSPDKTTIDEAHAAKFGWTANVTGILVLYNSTPYLIPMSTGCFEYTELVEKTADEKIDIELDALTMVEKLGADKIVEVIAAGVNYTEVVLTWASNSEYAVVAADGKSIAFTIPETETTVTITVIGNIGETRDTRTFEVVLTPITVSYVANTPYYFSFTDKDGTVKYLDGENAGGKDFRWNLTDDVTKAAVFYVEVVDGGYYVYFMKGETKTYLNIVKNGTYINLLAGAEGVSKWTYDVALEALVVEVEGTLYVPKNYNAYTNVEAKKIDHVQGDTYVATLSAMAFNIAFENNGVMQYLDGTTAANANYRWNLTADKALAATFYVEGNADGTYYIYFYKDGVKTYLNIVKNGNYTNLLAGDTAVSKWTYNEEVKAYVVDVEGTLYVPKNYNNFTNVEAKTLDYTYGDTFVLSLYNVGYTPAGGEVTPPEGGEGGEVTPPAGGEDPNPPVTEGKLELTVDSLNLPSQSYTANTVTVNGIGLEFVQIGNYGDGIQMRDKDGKTSILWNTTAITKGIARIELVFSDSKNTYNNADAVIFTFGNEMKGTTYTAKLSTTAGNKTYTITPDATTYTYFMMEHDLSYTMYWKSITIVYADGSSEPITPPAHEHKFVEGKCDCGEEDPNYVPPTVEPETPAASSGSADFDSIVLPAGKQNGDSGYTSTYTTANGWVSSNAAIQCGGTTVINPQFPVIGTDNTSKAPCLNGKTSAVGKLTSPTLNGGISKLTLRYTKMFTDTKLGFTITITDLTTGTKYTKSVSVELPKDEKYEVYTFEWELETAITGDFTIEIVNDCPSNSTSNKDRVTILDLSWVYDVKK